MALAGRRVGEMVVVLSGFGEGGQPIKVMRRLVSCRLNKAPMSDKWKQGPGGNRLSGGECRDGMSVRGGSPAPYGHLVNEVVNRRLFHSPLTGLGIPMG